MRAGEVPDQAKGRGRGWGSANLQAVATSVTDVDRDSAFTAVLEHVFANREDSAALGIDVQLFEELYR
jgi:hypothetical protein